MKLLKNLLQIFFGWKQIRSCPLCGTWNDESKVNYCHGCDFNLKEYNKTQNK